MTDPTTPGGQQHDDPERDRDDVEPMSADESAAETPHLHHEQGANPDDTSLPSSAPPPATPAAAPAAEPASAPAPAWSASVAPAGEPAPAGSAPAEPAAAEPAAAEPAAPEPAAAEPAGAEPAWAAPASAASVAEPAAEPGWGAAAEPTNAEPTAAGPTAAEPTAAGPTAAEPTAAGPTAAEPDAAATEEAAESAPRADAAQAAPSADAAAESAAAPSVPPLSPPAAAAAGQPWASGALHDDDALRAAEAARTGAVPAVPEATTAIPTTTGTAPGTPGAPITPPAAGTAADAPTTTGAGAGAAADADALDDTRLTSADGTRASSWTPPPAPASPADTETPAPLTTPTPYAPPTQALQAAAVAGAPHTSTTPIQGLGTSPAERLGFGDGIPSDDGFTDEELAQRRALAGELSFRQKQEFAGINIGAGFFGWLAATGLGLVVGGIVAGVAQASGFAKRAVIDGTATSITSSGTTLSVETIQITALVIVLVILLISYFVGGFVASRMARFSGLKQGFAVWLWGLFLAVIGAVVALVVGSQSPAVTQFRDQFSTLTVNDFITVPALIVEGLVLVLSIGGALLGGLAGTAFHRKVDRFGLEEV